MIFKNNINVYLLSICLGMYINILVARTTGAFNQDPYPLFSIAEPKFLLHKRIAFYKEEDDQSYEALRDTVQLDISPFGISADRGRTSNGLLPVNITQNGFADNPSEPKAHVPLGDLEGRINLIPLVFGPEPLNANLPPTLQTAKEVIFGPVLDGNGNIDDGQYIDPQENLGCESVYFKYTKKGIRVNLSARFSQDFGGSISAGIASVKQSLQKFIDKTADPDETADPFDPKVNTVSIKENVETYLAKQFPNILSELNQALADDTSRTSFETVECSLFWRHVFELMPEYDDWLNILLIPYIEGTATVSPGAKKRSTFVYDSVFGNNQHSAVGVTTGMYIDFIETIYIDTSFGYTHFFKHSFDNVPVPNSPYQVNLYPFSTDISVKPGANWYFSFKMGCYQFIDKLSCFVEYAMMEHKKNSITLKTDDPAFLPGALERTSPFKVKLCNFAISYAFSPNASVGFLWQAPISQRNAYKSTTVMLSLNAFI